MNPQIETERSMSRSSAPSDDHRSNQTQTNDIRYRQEAAKLIEAAENLDGPEIDICRAACLQCYLDRIAEVRQ